MPEKCYCAEEVDKKTLPPLPITLSIQDPKKPVEHYLDE
jgi:hypothetical protein